MRDEDPQPSGNGADVRFGLWYDFRNPQPSSRTFTQLYADALDQIEWAEGLGFGSVWLTEHHFSEDGYTPSPLIIGSAIGARTRAMMISTSLMLLPLHDPIRLAEDCATLSLLTGGRFHLGVGMGYRQIEYDAFHRKLSHRPSLMEEAVELIRRAWAGESMQFDGKRFSVPDVRVTPIPESCPKLLLGGESEPAIDRAARIGDGYLGYSEGQYDLYLDALERHGRDRTQATIHAGHFVIIDEDPERTWARVGKHAVYQLNEYINWGAYGGAMAPFESPAAVLEAGAYKLWDGPTAVREFVSLVERYPQVVDMLFYAQLPGEPIDSGSQRLEYVSTHVIPKVKAELAARAA